MGWTWKDVCFGQKTWTIRDASVPVTRRSRRKKHQKETELQKGAEVNQKCQESVTCRAE